jgi:rhamnogalacturonan endolyase
VPGTYALHVTGADQPVDLDRDGAITVDASKPTDVGTLDWAPDRRGRTLWQIGTFDRAAAEFRNGDDARDFQMFLRYPKQFPNDVSYTIGKSDLKTDWNYAHWSWFAKDPAWHVHFEAGAADVKGNATLTIAIASAQPAEGKLTDVRVAINGTEIGAIRLPKTGTAGYRGGTQDSGWHVLPIAFDAKLLHAGANELTLRHADAEPFKETPAEEKNADNVDADAQVGTGGPGQVMYDAIRLQVQE